MKKKYIYALSICSIFNDIDPKEYESLLKSITNRVRIYKKGEVIIHFGDVLDYFGIIVDGSIKSSFLNENYNEISISKFSIGDSFAEAMAINKIASSMEVSALEDTTVLFININDILNNKDDNKQILLINLLKTVASKNSFLNLKVRIMSQKTLRKKILMYISSLPTNSNGYHILNINKTKLATFIGANRSALSREISRMHKEGIIKKNANLIKVCK